MRQIDHPGTPAALALTAAAATARRMDLELPAGQSLRSALTELLDRHRADAAVLTFSDGAFAPLHYVMPAESPTSEHSVYFSARHSPSGSSRLLRGAITCGRRDGERWLHCHAFWVENDDSVHGGHVLPEESIIAAPIEATAWLLRGASFEVVADAHTRFNLFSPVAGRSIAAASGLESDEVPCHLVRVAPNRDLCTELEAFCRERGIVRARVRGGVGSLIGAQFVDGRQVAAHITEAFIDVGEITPDEHGAPCAMIEVSLVDYLGGLNRGVLQRGVNPVLVTFELVLEVLEVLEMSELN